MNLKGILSAGIGAGLLVSGLSGCVTVDTELGQDYMPLEQQYDVYTQEWDLQDISSKKLSQMSGYSDRRITIGAIRDKDYGLTRKGSAFSLVPANDSLDFGTNPVIREFHFSAVRDTFNVVNSSQTEILQNVNVYSLDKLGKSMNNLSYMDELNNGMFAGDKKITKGIPVYDGGDSLSFKFSNEFGQDMIDKFVSLSTDGLYIYDTISTYLQTFPGIYMCTDDPVGYGGRIDMFNVPIDVEDSYIDGNYAEMKFTSTYDGELVDTSFIFLFGAVAIPESSSDLPDQYAFNVTEIVGGKNEAAATDNIYIEGGNGVKPVFSGKEIYTLLKNEFENNEHIAKDGVTLDQIVVNKATITMPFTFPSDYKYMEAYPQTLSPCCRMESTDSLGNLVYTYANLTDASISAEAHGAVDRSNCDYKADISFHAQQMVQNLLTGDTPTDSTLRSYDVWFLITYTETNESSSSSSSSSSYSDYLNQLYYYNYLNQLYGGYSGYGYGSYGYSGYGYNNYYSMLMYSSLYSSSSSSSSSDTSDELDRDRFYGAILHGPASSGKKPTLTISYSVPKKETVVK